MTEPAGKRTVNWKDAPMLGNVLAATPAKSGGFNPSTLILILVVVVAFYMLMIRPQRRRAQQAQQKQSSVQPGARVRTTAGMYATVVDVDGDDVILEVAPGIDVRYMRRAVMEVITPGEADEAEPADDEAQTDDEYAEDEQPHDTEPAEVDGSAGTAEPGSAEDHHARSGTDNAF